MNIYEKVQNVVSQLSTQYDIGVVGGEMRIPVDYGFHIKYPYGLKLNTKTFDSVSMHNGIDFRIPENTIVYFFTIIAQNRRLVYI